MILIRITNEENNSFSFTRVGIEEETADVVVSITLVPNIFNSIDEKLAGNEKSSLERSVGIETGSFSSKDKANSIPFTQDKVDKNCFLYTIKEEEEILHLLVLTR